jgi:hypothetical protein
MAAIWRTASARSGVAIVHERSPSRPPTTMSAVRSTRRPVGYRRGPFPRPLTIYARNVENVSVGRPSGVGANHPVARQDQRVPRAATGRSVNAGHRCRVM